MSTLDLAVIVLAHKNPEQVALMLQVLQHPQIHAYVHVDSSVRTDAFPATCAAHDVPQISWLQRYRTQWGGIGLVEATLHGLARARADGCSYIILISGEDVPLRSASELVDFALAAGDQSFIEYWQLPTNRWSFDGRSRTDFYTYSILGRRETCIPFGEDTSMLNLRGKTLNTMLRVATSFKPQRRFPSYLTAFGGSQWLNLSASAADAVLSFVAAHPGYWNYHRHTQIPDELFIQSILLGSGDCTTLPVTNDDLRFVDWPHGSSHPRLLTLRDLPALETATDLFARKVDRVYQPELFSRLLERVRP